MTEVGVNLLWLAPGRVGGSEESTLASLRAIHERSPEDLRLRLFATRGLVDAHPDLPGRFPVELLPAAVGARPLRLVAESTWLAARTRGLDLVHHAGGTLPPVRTAPAVLTLHDLQPLERTATHGRVKRTYLGVAVPRSLAAARVVVVPSEFVAGTVRSRFPEVAPKLRVVPHGVAAPPVVGEEAVAAVRDRLRLDGPVVLYPAITYPHKNHRVLVAAFAQVVRQHPDAVLVLTGGSGSEEATLADQVRALGLEAHVRRTGRIPADELAALYRLAAVVAVPSRYEGFGLPAAEAMAHGAPLVAATAGALPEVVGDAGVLVDPDDVAAWAAAIAALVGDDAERARLAEAGRRRAAALSWSANAEGLLAAYREALGT